MSWEFSLFNLER